MAESDRARRYYNERGGFLDDPGESQSEYLPCAIPVRFRGITDQGTPIPGTLIGFGHSVDEAWDDVLTHRQRDRSEMTYDDYEGA